mmetsp:Transcript_5740/g.8026  ORF Transcript_5740/g.8026 Transcript_5740/m.8026 type:complete len:320 (-) Transcript_5740:42-1001(-)
MAEVADKFESFLDANKIVTWGLRILGPILVVVLMAILGGLTYTYFIHLLPYHFPEYTDYTWLGYTIHISLGVFILFNIVFNYFMVVFTNPGHATKEQEDYMNQLDRQLQEEAQKKYNFGIVVEDNPTYFVPRSSVFRWCKKCNLPKPPRAHHCAVCKQCVLRLDHHCPWMMNCVGFYNHKYFVLFLLYLWVGCLYITYMSAPLAWKMFFTKNKRDVAPTVLMTFLLGAVFAVFMIGFAGMQVYNMFTNQTQYEFYDNVVLKRRYRRFQLKYTNPYDLGYRKNMELFFGTGKDLWTFFVPSMQPPPGDGISFPTVHSQNA